MKSHLFLVISCLFVYSCSNKSDDTTTTEKNANEQTQPTEIPINANYPFGCTDLHEFKFELKLFARATNSYRDVMQEREERVSKRKELEAFIQCFDSIHQVETQKVKPEVRRLAHLTLSKQFTYMLDFDSTARNRVDNLKYRLPDIGKYECYYFFEQSNKLPGYYGNLLLLDPKTKVGTPINIYYAVGANKSMAIRYFNIDGETIQIFEGSYTVADCFLRESFKIHIKPNGEIMVEELKLTLR